MDNQFLLNRESKQAIIALLIEMAESDQSIDPKETKYIAGVANQMGLTMDDISKILRHPKSYEFQSPPAEQERMTILYYFLFLMRADGKITQNEENRCFKLGLRLGFNHNLVADLIGVLKAYLHDDVPPEAMLEKVRKYLN